jgi:hypothetical protein
MQARTRKFDPDAIPLQYDGAVLMTVSATMLAFILVVLASMC